VPPIKDWCSIPGRVNASVAAREEAEWGGHLPFIVRRSLRKAPSRPLSPFPPRG
jgi:hypothetical protein